MKFLRNPASLFLALATASFVFASCKNTTAPSSTLPSVPRYGSTLTQVYSSSGYIDTTTITVDSAFVTDPNASGSIILKLEESSNGQPDSTYESIEPNGDVALEGTPWGKSGVFEVLPFATTAAVNSSFTDVGGLVTLSAVNDGAGQPFVLNGASYTTDSVTVSQIAAGTTTQFHYTYIPSLGIVCQMIDEPDPISGVVGSSEWIIAYTPK